MDIPRKVLTAVNRALLTAQAAVARVLPSGAWSVGEAPLPRLDVVWLPAVAGLGTVHIPAPRLRELAGLLDCRSFAALLGHCRRHGSRSRTVNDTGADVRATDDLHVNFDYYSAASAPLAVPYVLHPYFYATGRQRPITWLRQSRRPFRLVFAGTDGPQYDRLDRFSILPRHPIVECLLETFRDDTLLVTDRAGIAGIDRTDRPILVVLKRAGGADDNGPHFFPPARYLQTVASAAFAVCPPGYTVPHSHNLVEAGAVGTIPVTNYHRLCRPPLIPGLDCLGFDTLAEFESAVRSALAMPEPHIAVMRQATEAYYDIHMHPAAFAARLTAAVRASKPPVQVAALNEHWSPRLHAEHNATKLPTSANPDNRHDSTQS